MWFKSHTTANSINVNKELSVDSFLEENVKEKKNVKIEKLKSMNIIFFFHLHFL